MTNTVLFTGFIGNIEHKRISESFTVCEFTLPYSYKSDDKEVTHWIPFKAYNKSADFIDKWFQKGDGIEIVGHLSTETWEKDGQTRKSMFVVVDKASFPPCRKNKDGSAPPREEESKPKARPADIMAPPPAQPREMDDDGDDLPF